PPSKIAAGGAMKMTVEDQRLYQRVHAVLEGINELEPDTVSETQSTPLIGALLQTVTNQWLIALLRVVRDHKPTFKMSQTLSKRSSLFDKLIVMKGAGKRDWVLRLHTYNMPEGDGRVSNLGESLKDDEENTHLHRWRLSSRFV